MDKIITTKQPWVYSNMIGLLQMI